MSMPSPPQGSSPRARPIGLLILLAVAAILYVLMLANAANEPAGGGESRMAAALEGLFVTFGLWVVLTIMLFVGGSGGAIPLWVAFLAIALVPMSGVAAVTALDMGSRHMAWAIVFPLLLPALIAFYALWAGLPRLHAALPAERTSVAVWAAIFFLSVAAFVLAA